MTLDWIRDTDRDERSGMKVCDSLRGRTVLIVRSLQSRETRTGLVFDILLDWETNTDVAGDKGDEDEEKDFEVEFLAWGREIAVDRCCDERGWEEKRRVEKRRREMRREEKKWEEKKWEEKKWEEKRREERRREEKRRNEKREKKRREAVLIQGE